MATMSSDSPHKRETRESFVLQNALIAAAATSAQYQRNLTRRPIRKGLHRRLSQVTRCGHCVGGRAERTSERVCACTRRRGRRRRDRRLLLLANTSNTLPTRLDSHIDDELRSDQPRLHDGRHASGEAHSL